MSLRQSGLLACVCAVAALRATSGRAQGPSPAAPPTYPLAAYAAFGSSVALSGHFAELGWSEAQFEAFLGGMRAGFQGRPYSMDDGAHQLSAETGRRISEIDTHAAPPPAAPPLGPAEQLQGYMKEARKRLHLQESSSGLAYSVQAGRNGVRPRPGDTLIFTCVATTADGSTKIPELSSEHVKSKLEGMLPGLMEGLQMMTVGSQAIFVLPPSLSFGQGPWPAGVPAGTPLIFFVTLNDVLSAPPRP